MLKIKKIKEPIVNLNVQGQSGCCCDCMIRIAVGKKGTNTPGCTVQIEYTAKGNVFF